MPLKHLVDKAEQISNLRSTPPRPKMLKIFNYLGEIFKGPAGEKSDTEGKGSKILKPITLAQLKAGNNSEKLKNEIRQILYSLYRSKKLTKQLYKSLIDII